jgi:uncharacterized protein YkwD
MHPHPTPQSTVCSSLLLAVVLGACASAPPRSHEAPLLRSQEPPARDAEAPRVATDPTISALYEAHNRERANAGLPPLKPNSELQAAAERHARDMAEHEKMSHEGSNGSSPQNRIAKAGYRARATGENVAYGQRTAEQVMTVWMDSRPHKKNILGNFSEVGAAAIASEDGDLYWCVDFGLPWPKLEPDEAAATLVEAINRERVRAGKDPLSISPQLEAAVRRQVRDMAEQRSLEPKPSDRLTLFRRVEKSGYRFAKAAQNVAKGQPTPDDLLQAWLKGKAQKNNILGEYSQIGAAYAADTDGTPYWCVLFGIPLER